LGYEPLKKYIENLDFIFCQSLQNLCSPNEDFGRMNNRWNADFQLIFQWFVAQIEYSRPLFFPKSSVGRGKVNNNNKSDFSPEVSCVKWHRAIQIVPLTVTPRHRDTATPRHRHRLAQTPTAIACFVIDGPHLRALPDERPWVWGSP